MSATNKNSIQYWLIDPEYIPDPSASAQTAMADLKAALKEHGGSMAAGGQGDFWAEGWVSMFRPYTVLNGTLIIPVEGILLNKFPYQFGSWATGYEYIHQAILRGLDDSAVDEIVLAIDSGGGMVAGCFELCDDILAMRSGNTKPMKASVSGFGAYSAAYALAVCTDEIVVEKMAGTGSVGVVSMHVDYSKNLEQNGVAVTYVFAGKHKVDGNPYQVLPADVKKRWQAKIDKTYGVFVAHVAANRDVSEDEVRATEALTFDAEESIEIKFADRIGRLTHDLAAKYQTSDEPESDEPQAANGETPMATQPDQAAADAAAKATAEAAEKAAADAAAAARTEGAKAERARFAAVHASEELKGREALATHLLSNTDMTAEAIIGTLAAAPKTEAAAPAPAGKKDGFAAAMDSSANPDMAEGQEEIEDEDVAAQATLAAAMKAVGGGKKKR